MSVCHRKNDLDRAQTTVATEPAVSRSTTSTALSTVSCELIDHRARVAHHPRLKWAGHVHATLAVVTLTAKSP